MTLTINIKNESILDKFLWLLEHFKNEIEIESDDLKDYKLLKNSRNEKTISFEEYLKNENRN
jgi:hypothetical protein